MLQTFSTPDFWRPFMALVLAALVVMGSPGPATLSVTAIGAAFGLRSSLPYLTGIIAGTSAVLLVVAAGILSMLMALPRLAPLLLTASIAYILYLAVKIATAPPLSTQGGDVKAPSFSGGFLLGVANPKAYVAIAAVFTGSTLPIEPAEVEALAKAAVLGLMIVLIHLGWLLVGTSLSYPLRHPVGSRVLNLLFAATLVVTTLMALAR